MGSALEPQRLMKKSVFFPGRHCSLTFFQPQEAVKASSEGGVALLIQEGETEAYAVSSFTLGLC